MTTRVAIHDYRTDPLLSQKDGVNLAHENIATLLRDHHRTDLQATFHDLNALLADDDLAHRTLAAADCVVSNVGPHAHYYFYLREKLGLHFRIIRDVRTAIWSSYLLQEHLVAPLLRADDMLMVASHYTRAVYEKIFPHLRRHISFRCYPLTVAFPDLPPRPLRTADQPFTLGYIGRLSEDKNFPEVVELLVRLNQDEPGRYRLVACGDVHSESCHPAHIAAHLTEHLGPGEHFHYLPPRDNGGVWELYRQFDAMVFPSTSNLETLGRVLVEASHAGVPVICGAHAAAPELVPDSSLCAVLYDEATCFSSHFDHRLGRVCVADMARAVRNPALQPPCCHLDYQTHPEKFLAALDADAPARLADDHHDLAPAQARFVAALRVTMPEALDAGAACRHIADLVPWFLALQQQGSAQQGWLMDRLLTISRHPERTRRFIAKSNASNGDFTNVGGIDIELCHVLGFYPEFSLADVAAESLAGDVEGRQSSRRLSA